MTTIVDFFKLDVRKTVITLIFLAVGLVTLVVFIWLFAFGKSLIGAEPNILLFGLIAGFSPLFGVAIVYLAAFKIIPIVGFVLISFLSIFQFLYWYYLACLVVFVRDTFFKEDEMSFHQKF